MCSQEHRWVRIRTGGGFDLNKLMGSGSARSARRRRGPVTQSESAFATRRNLSGRWLVVCDFTKQVKNADSQDHVTSEIKRKAAFVVVETCKNVRRQVTAGLFI